MKENTFNELLHYMPLNDARLAYLRPILSSFVFVMRETMSKFDDKFWLCEQDFTKLKFHDMHERIKEDPETYAVCMNKIKIFYYEMKKLNFICNNFGITIPSEYLL